MHAHSPDPKEPILVRIAQFMLHAPAASLPSEGTTARSSNQPSVELHIVLFPPEHASLAKSYWQHTGNGISSRLAEYCLSLIPTEGISVQNGDPLNKVSVPLPRSPIAGTKIGKRYGSKRGSATPTPQVSRTITPGETVTPKMIDDELTPEFNTYLEERYGRNLAVSNADLAKRALRRRIAGIIAPDEKMLLAPEEDLHGPRRRAKATEHDVFLFPAGMSAVWSAHQLALSALPPAKSVCFG